MFNKKNNLINRNPRRRSGRVLSERKEPAQFCEDCTPPRRPSQNCWIYVISSASLRAGIHPRLCEAGYSARNYKRFNNKKPLSGFTIIELIFTIFILIIGVFAIYGVYSKIVSDTNLSVSKLTAAYLAQEGIEIVRNIRDTNWVNGQSWNTGLSPGGLEEWEADYSTILSPYNSPGRFLRIAPGGFYNYDTGVTTKFRREIIVDNSDPSFLEVHSEVDWNEKGKDYNISIQENLYPWWPQ